MNIQSSINKLMLAINHQGNNIQLYQKTFYSEKSKRYITSYSIRKWRKDLWSGYGKAELLKFLVSYYKEGEANGKTN